MVLPATTPVATLMVPAVVMAKPAGAPTRLSCTSPGAGGLTALRASLASTLVLDVPPASIPLRVSSAATRVPVLTLSVTIEVLHSAAFGAGRQAW
ncbi:hypothetical protein D3C71_1531210 [compost metagenome]